MIPGGQALGECNEMDSLHPKMGAKGVGVMDPVGGPRGALSQGGSACPTPCGGEALNLETLRGPGPVL